MNENALEPLTYFACPTCQIGFATTIQSDSHFLCQRCKRSWLNIKGVYVLGEMKLPEIHHELEGIKVLDQIHGQKSQDPLFRKGLLELPNLLNDFSRSDVYFWDVSIGKRTFNKFVQSLPQKPSAILELGADWCWASSRLAEQGHQVYAMDINREHLTSAQFLIEERKGFIRVQADMNHLPFQDGCFDIVLGIASVHHTTDLPHTLQEIARVLKPGGQVILLREPVRGRYAAADAFGREEKLHGIHETAPLLSEWLGAFNQARLSPKFHIAYLDFLAGGWSFIRLLRTLKRLVLSLPVLGTIFHPYVITDYDFQATKH